MGDKNKIIIGSALFKICGIDVGYTEGGVVLRRELQYEQVENDHAPGVKRSHVVQDRYFVVTTLLESTLQNMQRVLQEPIENLSGSTLTFGGDDPIISEYSLTIIGKGISNKTRTYVFYRAAPSDANIEYPIGRRSGASILPLTFELFRDITNQYKIGYCVEA